MEQRFAVDQPRSIPGSSARIFLCFHYEWKFSRSCFIRDIPGEKIATITNTSAAVASNCPARKTVAQRPNEKSFFPGRSAPIFPLISVLRCKSMRNRRRGALSSLLERGTNVGQTIPWGVRLASSKVSFRKVDYLEIGFSTDLIYGNWDDHCNNNGIPYSWVRIVNCAYKFCEFLFNRLVHKLARFSLHIKYYLVTIAYHLCLILMSFDNSCFLFLCGRIFFRSVPITKRLIVRKIWRLTKISFPTRSQIW